MLRAYREASTPGWRHLGTNGGGWSRAGPTSSGVLGGIRCNLVLRRLGPAERDGGQVSEESDRTLPRLTSRGAVPVQAVTECPLVCPMPSRRSRATGPGLDRAVRARTTAPMRPRAPRAMRAFEGPTHEPREAAGAAVARAVTPDVTPGPAVRPLRRRPLNGRAVMGLQRSAGNSAVVALLAPPPQGRAKTQPAGPIGPGPESGLATMPAQPVVQRKAGGACPPEPGPPPPAAPETDPKFAKVRTDVDSKAKALKAHPTSGSEAKKAAAAAQAPAGDKEAQAKAAQADKMARRQARAASTRRRSSPP